MRQQLSRSRRSCRSSWTPSTTGFEPCRAEDSHGNTCSEAPIGWTSEITHSSLPLCGLDPTRRTFWRYSHPLPSAQSGSKAPRQSLPGQPGPAESSKDHRCSLCLDSFAMLCSHQPLTSKNRRPSFGHRLQAHCITFRSALPTSKGNFNLSLVSNSVRRGSACLYRRHGRSLPIQEVLWMAILSLPQSAMDASDEGTAKSMVA